MDWQQRLTALAAPLAELSPAQWLAVATSAGFLLLLGVLIAQSQRHRRLRQELDGYIQERRPDGSAEKAGQSPLDGISLSPIDRVFPRKPGPFLTMVGIIAFGTWIVGYLLAPDIAHFRASKEWLFQPFYIAAHLIALRLVIHVFTRNYAAGVAHLQVSRTEALRGVRTILGPYGVLAAALIALPFCYFDFQYLFTPRYARMGQDDIVRPVDYLMWGIWSLEWFVNAFIWVLFIGFMVKNCSTISHHPFRAPIHVVLHDKLYRPFLQMSAQGSTVMLGFSCVTVAYLYFTGGELTDYLGLAITVSLLVFGFVPPWLMLRRKVDRAVAEETISLQQGAGLIPASAAASLEFAEERVGERSLDARLDEVHALLRIWHLQNLYGNLGQTEAKAIMLRLLAPAATIGWQVVQNYGNLSQNALKLIGMGK